MDKKRTNAVSVLLIVIVGLTIYFNALGNEFVWDDQVLISKNPLIGSWGNIPRVFTTRLYWNKNPNVVKSDIKTIDFYRPLQTISYMLDFSFWKLRPAGYRLTNILLHIVNAIFLYSLLNLISNNQKVSCAAALLFVCHAVHTQAVTYIAGRADILAGLFLLLLMILYIKRFQFAAVISFALALLSKEIAFIFPFVLAAYEICYGSEKRTVRQRLLYRVGPFFMVSIAYIVLRFFALNLTAEALFQSKIAFYIRLITMPRIIIEYIYLLFLPLNLHMQRFIMFSTSIFDIRVIISVIALGCLFAAVYINRRRFKIVSFGMLWFFIMLFPALNVFATLNAQMSEHWLYLPSLGFFMALSTVMVSMYGAGSTHAVKRFSKAAITGIFISAVVLYSVLTFERNKDWKDNTTIYADTLRYAPHNSNVRYNIGNAYFRMERYDDALAEYLASVKIDPRLVGSYINIGGIYDSRGEHERALEVLREGARANPGHAFLYQAMGAINIHAARYSDAIAAYKKAIALGPGSADLYSGLGIAYLKGGSYSESETSLKKALKLSPRSADIHYYLGVVYFYKKNLKKAEDEWRTALRLNSGHALAREGVENLNRIKK